MAWFLLHLVMFLVDLLTVTRRSDRDKDLEILLLRHQLRLVQRERPRSPRLTRWEKVTLAVHTAKLARLSAGPRARLAHVLRPGAAQRAAGAPWREVRHPSGPGAARGGPGDPR